MGYPIYASTGLTHHDKSKAFQGVTIYTPLGSGDTFLIDMEGEIVHTWTAPAPLKPFYGFLRDNGNLSLHCFTGDEPFQGGGFGGTVLELDWEGHEVSRYENPAMHHDREYLRNGNMMIIGWEPLPTEFLTKVKGGTTPAGETPTEILGDYLYEVTPKGDVVWEWHGSDKLDTNIDIICPLDGRHEWTHCNSVAEMEDGNILLSFRSTSMILILEKSTGDVIWRFGPGVLSHQHNPTPLPNGNILIFDNGEHRIRGGSYSRVVELDPKTNEIIWQYRGKPSLSLFSTGISGAQRLPNGNTLICDGRSGILIEVTAEGELVWEFVNPGTYPWRGETGTRAIFRAQRYAVDGPEVKGRL